jgi:hypothetical protein
MYTKSRHDRLMCSGNIKVITSRIREIFISVLLNEGTYDVRR